MASCYLYCMALKIKAPLSLDRFFVTLMGCAVKINDKLFFVLPISVIMSFKSAFTESGNMIPRVIRLTSTLRQVTSARNQSRDFPLRLPRVFGWGFRNNWGMCGVFSTYLQGEGSSNCQLPTIVHLFNFVVNNLSQLISIPAIVSHFYFHVLSTWIVVACWKLTWIKKCSKLNKTAETSAVVDSKGVYFKNKHPYF